MWETSPLFKVWQVHYKGKPKLVIYPNTNVIHKRDTTTTSTTVMHFTLYEPKCKPFTLSHAGLRWYLPGQTKLSGTLPNDVEAAAIQTVSVCVTKCVGSHGCLSLHGWERLHQLPNPFFLQIVLQPESYSGSPRRHIVISLPCRSAMPHTQQKELEGTSLWMVNLNCVIFWKLCIIFDN